MEYILKNLKFLKRPLSWVALTSEFFYKIPKNSDDLEADFYNPVCIEEASKEYELACYLSDLDKNVNKPLSINGACIIYPLLSGPDMTEILKNRKDDGVVQKSIESAVSLLGRLHQKSTGVSVFHVHDYGNNPFTRASCELLPQISAKKKSVVIYGFEVRNFRFDKTKEQWIFFDPHNICQGLPEEDFARFVVSLLMVNWGENHKCNIWQRFNLKTLIDVYEDSASSSLDRQLLQYAFSLVLAMRRHNAVKSVYTMGCLKRIFARVYLEVYFYQMNKWVEKNAVTVR